MRDQHQEINELIEFKKDYLPPQLEITIVEMENGIAAGSAMAVPLDINNKAYEQWSSDTDVYQETPWY
ncbi:TPA: hypothetical protein ACGZ92_002605 [Elizabethkingia anophelis]